MKLIHQLLPRFLQLPEVIESLEAITNQQHELYIQGLVGSSKALYLASYVNSAAFTKTSFVITVTQREAEQWVQDIRTFLPDTSRVLFYPDWDIRTYEPSSPYADQVHQRIQVMHHLLDGNPYLVVMSLRALLRYILPKDVFQQEYILIEKNDDYEFEDITRNLVELGYERETIVSEPGTFTVKGGIIDIFPSSLEHPIRLDFFGDTVESIRYFDVITQKSVEELPFVEILPQREIMLLEKYVLQAIDTIETRFDPEKFKDKHAVMEKLMAHEYFQGIELYQPYFYDLETLLDYVPKDVVLFLDETAQLKQQDKTILYETESIYRESHHTSRVRPEPQELFSTLGTILEKYPNQVHLSGIERKPFTESVFDIPVSDPPVYKNDYDLLKADLQQALDHENSILVLSSFEGQALRLEAVLQDFNPILGFELVDAQKQPDSESKKRTEPVPKPKKSAKRQTNKELKPGHIYLELGELSHGVHLPGITLILDREILGRKKSFLKKMRKVESTPIESFVDLKEGDYVVHIHHGIGQYIGIERMQALDVEKDYILLQFADEKLYVPIEQLNLVQKYLGGEVRKSKLDKLGSKSWEQRKAKAIKNAQQLAKELVEISAVRKNHPGTAYGPDTPWQYMFESQFEYEETPDQLQAIEEVKQDMQKPVPMDRLICGDVGYGKTEVAMRAAFKAVMEGKQVGILVPTTVLSEQHFFTFKERFGEFPITVEMLSRFRSKGEQTKIIEKLKQGAVDVVIGTHRLLSKDITFKNLGLIIIDEEQRFGVRHKEKLKKIRTMVDVVSMSATPIPRTLNMSLSQIRDMSIINTPPENRLPIDTFTMEFNEEIIKKAISQEINRGGQCYFVFNRVEGIISFTGFLMKLLPAVRFRYAHGQMDERELEEVMRGFIEHKFDVLVCTTIIESGMDIPNVNTILIDRADALGLSQLYQLRGRVGRSRRQAYCYLFYPIDRPLTETAQKRLAVINEYTNLGGGFKIAMRDMEIRGAGNILGPEQSGDIINVGYELYYKILADAINELKTGTVKIEIDTQVDLNCDSFIPDEYIQDTRQKIEMYKKFAACESHEELEWVYDEFCDRFGPVPEPVANLFQLGKIKVVARKIHLTSVVEKGEDVEIIFNEYSLINAHRLVTLIQLHAQKLSTNPKKQESLIVHTKNMNLHEKTDFILKLLQDLAKDK